MGDGDSESIFRDSTLLRFDSFFASRCGISGGSRIVRFGDSVPLSSRLLKFCQTFGGAWNTVLFFVQNFLDLGRTGPKDHCSMSWVSQVARRGRGGFPSH